MKKLICFLSMVMVATCLFAAGAKWKSSDIYHQKKFDKLIQTYNLTKTYSDDKIEFYKNEDTSDWVYITRKGSEENGDKRIFFVAFASLGGVFDSCTVYGGYTNAKENVKYMYSYINEANTAIQKGDFLGKSSYIWNNQQYIFYIMGLQRIMEYRDMLILKDTLGITTPEEVDERYAYFLQWISEHNRKEKVEQEYIKAYKAYLAEHK